MFSSPLDGSFTAGRYDHEHCVCFCNGVYLPLDMEVLSSFHEPRGYLAVDNQIIVPGIDSEFYSLWESAAGFSVEFGVICRLHSPIQLVIEVFL